MENASKALLIAGGVILAMLLIAVLIFAWGKFSEYYDNQQSISEIEDVTEFNLKFTNYDRDDVYGYEILSLANQVADYNMRFSNYTASASDEGDRSSKNNQNYTPIKMTVLFPPQLQNTKRGVRDLIWYSDDYTDHLFNDGQTKIQSSTIKQIEPIIETVSNTERYYSTAEATKLAKSLGSLFISSDEIKHYAEVRGISEEAAEKVLKEDALKTYNSITRKNETSYANMESNLKTHKIRQYYEYTQFKRAIFKCVENSIQYDQVSGRVSQITFEFTGTIK